MLLELDQLTVRYEGRAALDGLTASLDSRSLGLLGPNGAGKSTLIKTLLGLIRPDSGLARLAGLDVRTETRRVREAAGYMPEHEACIEGMSVVRFLRYMGELCGLPPRTAMERAHETLFHVGLGEVRYRTIEGFSYGMMQKVRLAQALIHGPRVLILDEPANGLDPEAREDMLRLIRDVSSGSGSRVILCSHLLRDVETACHDVLVLRRGRAAAAGNIEAMRRAAPGVYELTVKGNADAYMAKLAELGCDCSMDERESLRVRAPLHLETRAFFEAALASGVRIRHFRSKRNTLEDVFLEALEEAVPAADAGS